MDASVLRVRVRVVVAAAVDVVVAVAIFYEAILVVGAAVVDLWPLLL